MESYKALVDSISEVFFALDGNLRCSLWNKAADKLTGVSANEAIGKSLYDVFPNGEDTARAEQLYREVMQSQEPRTRLITYEMRGRTIFFELDASPFGDGVSVIARDVTEREQLREALAQNESRFRSLIENSFDAITVFSVTGEHLYASPAIQRIIGFAPEDLLGCNVFELIHPEDRAYVQEQMAELVQEDGNIRSAQVRLLHKDGSARWIEGVARNLLREPAVHAIVANWHDISEHKRFNATLQAQFDQFSSIFDSINALVYAADMKTYELLFINAYGKNAFATDPLGQPCFKVLQHGRTSECSFCTNDRLIRDGEIQKPYVWEFHNALSGRWFQCIDRAIPWVDGRTVRLEIAMDITKRKRNEQALEKASQEWRTTFDGIRDGILVLDRNLKVIRCNRAMRELAGADFTEILGRPYHNFMDGLRDEVGDSVPARAMRSRHRESRILTIGDRSILAVADPLLDQEGVVTGMVCVLSDITEQRRDEEALRQTTQMLEALIQASPLAICVLDLDARVQLWNPACEHLFGWTTSEVLGQPYPATADHKEVELILKEARWGNACNELKLRRRKKDGSPIDIILSTAPMVDANGTVIASLGIVTDITHQKRAEEALRESEQRIRELASESVRAQEEERRWLSSAVHDRIAQNLVAVYQRLEALRHLARGDQAREAGIMQATALQQNTIAEARSIMENLYSPALDAYGLVPAIREELWHFEDETGCHAILTAECAQRLPKHVEGSLYRIFCEGLASVKSYNPKAKNLEVDLLSGPDGVILRLKDDDPVVDVDHAMRNVASGALVSMRRRSEVMSGTFDVTSEAGVGTTVTVQIPAKYVWRPDNAPK